MKRYHITANMTVGVDFYVTAENPEEAKEKICDLVISQYDWGYGLDDTDDVECEYNDDCPEFEFFDNCVQEIKD